jgi:hypothetical protein
MVRLAFAFLDWTWREALYSTNSMAEQSGQDSWRDIFWSRANGAEDASPGQYPGLRSDIFSSALKGRRIPAPLQGATIDR